MKRYFIVYYTITLNKIPAVGQISIETEGSYINLNETMKIIKEKGFIGSNCAITGIQELSESDFNDFTAIK